ncbi:hypothetical protein MLD38_010662 [Melastoma candidum]|uniref:Uncharacterized protein n=1 Tax=Melastoma candidum TaxID=119954 RepID=A0ACB9R0L6_9MYRT|nr:hypothetical protein MLD38_010662 [Melastoma candidum]
MAAAAVAAACSKTLESVFRESTRFYCCHATTSSLGKLQHHRLRSFPCGWQHQTRRALILESAKPIPISESIKSIACRIPIRERKKMSASEVHYFANTLRSTCSILASRWYGTQRPPRITGKSVAKELIFTGGKITGKDDISMGSTSFANGQES